MVDGSRFGAGTGVHRRSFSRVHDVSQARWLPREISARVAGPRHGSPRARKETLLVAAGAALLLLTTCGLFLGRSPIPQLLVSALLTLLAVGQRLPWSLALSGVILGGCTLLALLMPLYPSLHLPLVVADGVVPMVVGAICVLVLWRRRGALRLPTPPARLVAAGALLPPVVASAYVIGWRWVSPGPNLAWMMNADSASHVWFARFIVDDGGLTTGPHLNVAPLTNEALAFVMAPGRESTAALAHDLVRSMDTMLLVLGAISVVAGVLAARAVPDSFRWSRLTLCVAASALPWCYAISGLALRYGFWNAPFAMLLLLVSWLIWLESDRHPVAGTALQALSGLAMLATWSPLVLVPLALGGVTFLHSWRAHLALRGRALAGFALAPALLLLYAALVTLPGLTTVRDAKMGGLASDGAFFAWTWQEAIASAAALAIALLMPGVMRGTWTHAVGGGLVALAGGVALVYLLHERVGAVTGLWGYYPQKYSWILLSAGALVALATVAELVAGAPMRRQRAAVVAISLLAAGLVLTRVQPMDLRPATVADPALRPTPDWKLQSVLPLASLPADNGMNELDAAVPTILTLSAAAQKSIVFDYYGDGAIDGLVNFWLLQMSSPDPSSALHFYAFTMSQTDASQLCPVIDAFDERVTVLTSNRLLPNRLQKHCPDSEFSVRVAPRPPSPSVAS